MAAASPKRAGTPCADCCAIASTCGGRDFDESELESGGRILSPEIVPPNPRVLGRFKSLRKAGRASSSEGSAKGESRWKGNGPTTAFVQNLFDRKGARRAQSVLRYKKSPVRIQDSQTAAGHLHIQGLGKQ